MFRARTTAGRSSQRKYDELLRSWQRRNRRLFVVLGCVCGGVLVGSLLAAEKWPSNGWAFGLAGGMALSLFMFARLTPPGWIENWQWGSWGEQSTAKALRALEAEGWVVIHDLSAGRGNVDHIVIGTGGVFLLDSKRLGGQASVDDEGLLVRRLDDPDLTYRMGDGHLLGLARETHERVLASSRINTWVTAVMVIWADFPQGVVTRRCVYADGNSVVAWLRLRPQAIAPERVQQVAEAVRQAWA